VIRLLPVSKWQEKAHFVGPKTTKEPPTELKVTPTLKKAFLQTVASDQERITTFGSEKGSNSTIDGDNRQSNCIAKAIVTTDDDDNDKGAINGDFKHCTTNNSFRANNQADKTFD
jgi:hypothetical protein